MAKGITNKQWLNLVIIIISALVLAFMLLGRFFNIAVEQSHKREKSRLGQPSLIIKEKPNILKLVMIDFGLNKVVLNAEELWVDENQANTTISESDELNEITERWEHLLSAPFIENTWDKQVEPKVRATVLLYFKNKQQPLILKVEGVNSKEKIGDVRVTFIASGKQIILHDLTFSQLVYEDSQ
jgi:hypothetical protein